MVPVRVTVAMGRKIVPIDEVKDNRISVALKQAGKDLGLKLAKVSCPTHHRGPTHVRLHIDGSGNGDVKYDSCCEKLAEAIGKVL